MSGTNAGLVLVVLAGLGAAAGAAQGITTHITGVTR
jgi:hypothetical protein